MIFGKEILAEETLLKKYDNIKDAVNKIEQVLESNALQDELREYLAKQAEKFSSERFMSEIREVVHSFLKENAKIQK